MTRSEAAQRARRLWGKKAAIEAGLDMSSPEQRQAASDKQRAINTRRAEIAEDIRQRLAKLDWYQAYQKELAALRVDSQQISAGAFYYKFSVGYITGFTGFAAFHLEGRGDTWEEAFAMAERKVVAP